MMALLQSEVPMVNRTNHDTGIEVILIIELS